MKYYHELNLKVYLNLLSDLNDLNLSWYKSPDPFGGDQICLNAPDEYLDDYHFGAGNFKRADVPEGFVFVRGTEEIRLSTKTIPDWKLCDVFKGTVFEEIYDMLHKEFDVGRIRFIKTKPKTCMNWHKDPIARLHYPIQTDEPCFMIIEDELYHLPIHKWTKAMVNEGNHTIINASKIERIHLVVDLLK